MGEWHARSDASLEQKCHHPEGLWPFSTRGKVPPEARNQPGTSGLAQPNVQEPSGYRMLGSALNRASGAPLRPHPVATPRCIFFLVEHHERGTWSPFTRSTQLSSTALQMAVMPFRVMVFPIFRGVVARPWYQFRAVYLIFGSSNVCLVSLNMVLRTHQAFGFWKIARSAHQFLATCGQGYPEPL